MGAHEVERGWRDNPYRVLKRSQYVKRQAELIGRRSLGHGYAHRCHVMRAFAIGDLILQGTLYRGRCWCLSACGLNRTHGRRRGATLQKFSTTGFFRVHGSLLGSCIPLPAEIPFWKFRIARKCMLSALPRQQECATFEVPFVPMDLNS